MQLAVIAAGALAGPFIVRPEVTPPRALPLAIGRRFAAVCLALAVAILLGLPLIRASLPEGESKQAVAVADAFYRSGSLVFGGGHVVLPLLHEAVVAPGWVTDDRFLAGYGAAQAVPGPLFTFAGYLGWALGPPPNGPVGALIALTAIFLPSFLLVFGALPFLAVVRRSSGATAALAGVSAVVVGILLATLYTPVWTSSVRGWSDVAIVGVDFLLLSALRLPPWSVVVASAVLGAVAIAAGLTT
jgi:chromate transporter